ncbi:hypothetical protein MN608_05455 [Microdochium nivale]|nr:hypothetical protein MN608_05455 [Microdochium nivale]
MCLQACRAAVTQLASEARLEMMQENNETVRNLGLSPSTSLQQNDEEKKTSVHIDTTCNTLPPVPPSATIASNAEKPVVVVLAAVVSTNEKKQRHQPASPTRDQTCIKKDSCKLLTAVEREREREREYQRGPVCLAMGVVSLSTAMVHG